jgi:magnesium transporter
VFLQRVRVRPVGRSGIYELYRLRFRVVPYLSEIQHRRVIEPNGNEVGKLADIAVMPQGQFPAAQWAILATPSGEKVVRWGDLAQEIGHLRLRNRLETIPDAQLPPGALRLARDLLDKQIVDTHGAKVVRVNDLQLSDVDGQLRLVGADVGLRGLLRRVGAEGVAERVLGLAGRRLPRGIIPWHLVEPLEPANDTPAKTAAVRLTIPHAKLALLHPADIADIVEEMTADERVAVFEQLDLETAAEALQEVEPEMQAAIVSDLPEERAADILEEMDPDEAADLLQDLPEERREELVELMETEEAKDVAELLTYPEDSAGGIMTSDLYALPAELTAAQAIDDLRVRKPDPELTYYLYVVDDEGRLEGVLSLRDLVVAAPETKVKAIMDPHVLRVDAETPKEEVAALIAKYDLLALPVVDARKKLIGTVTIDDVVELMLPRGWKKRSLRSIAR